MSKKVYSTFLYILIPGGLILPVIAGGALAIHYIGYPNSPNLGVLYASLPVGLLLAAEGHHQLAGTWKGLAEVLHVRLALAALVYLGWAFKYALAGSAIHLFPAGLMALVSAVVIASRLVLRFAPHERWSSK